MTYQRSHSELLAELEEDLGLKLDSQHPVSRERQAPPTTSNFLSGRSRVESFVTEPASENLTNSDQRVTQHSHTWGFISVHLCLV